MDINLKYVIIDSLRKAGYFTFYFQEEFYNKHLNKKWNPNV